MYFSLDKSFFFQKWFVLITSYNSQHESSELILTFSWYLRLDTKSLPLSANQIFPIIEKNTLSTPAHVPEKDIANSTILEISVHEISVLEIACHLSSIVSGTFQNLNHNLPFGLELSCSNRSPIFMENNKKILAGHKFWTWTFNSYFHVQILNTTDILQSRTSPRAGLCGLNLDIYSKPIDEEMHVNMVHNNTLHV